MGVHSLVGMTAEGQIPVRPVLNSKKPLKKLRTSKEFGLGPLGLLHDSMTYSFIAQGAGG